MRPTAIAMPSHIADGEPDVSWVIDHSDNAIVVCDDSARITWTNQGFTRMLGYTQEEAVGRRPSDFLAGPHTDPETVALFAGAVSATVGTVESVTVTVTMAEVVVFPAASRATAVIWRGPTAVVLFQVIEYGWWCLPRRAAGRPGRTGRRPPRRRHSRSPKR